MTTKTPFKSTIKQAGQKTVYRAFRTEEGLIAYVAGAFGNTCTIRDNLATREDGMTLAVRGAMLANVLGITGASWDSFFPPTAKAPKAPPTATAPEAPPAKVLKLVPRPAKLTNDLGGKRAELKARRAAIYAIWDADVAAICKGLGGKRTLDLRKTADLDEMEARLCGTTTNALEA